MRDKLTGQVTLEDVNGLEIEIDHLTGVKLLTIKKTQYPHLSFGDIFTVELIKVESEKAGCKCEDKNTDYHLLNCMEK